MMTLRYWLAAAALGLAATSVTLGQDRAPMRADQVASAIAAYEAAVKDVPLNNANYETYRKAADDAVASLNADTLSVGDIERLLDKQLLGRSQRPTQRKIDDRLAKLAEVSDADGARAALVRTTLNLVETSDDKATWKAHAAENKRRQMEAMNHPGLLKAVEAGGTKYLFANGSISSELADDAYAQAVEKVVAMPLAPDVTGRLWYAYLPMVEEKAPVTAATRERIRLACLERIGVATAGLAALDTTPVERERFGKLMNTSRRSFEGAYAKGALLNGPAPEIEFLWTDAEGAPRKLSELKGKVVVVDFWAVWCGPCVGSFPQVRELAERYKGFPVVVLGVTDLEGTPPPAGSKAPPAEWTAGVQCPALAAWAKEKDVTWSLAVANQSVFNPEYGVRGIPHVVILDPEGKVRHRGLHPAIDPAKKHEYIDALLAEFKLPSPKS